MAKKRFKAHLGEKSFIQLRDYVQKYREDFMAKNELFVTKLAEHGITVGQQNVGEFGKYITFSIELKETKRNVKAVMVATQTGLIHSEWRTLEGDKSADVSPLLLAEFGSGLKAQKNPMGPFMKPRMGTGTFPGQTHAEDPEGWWYMTLDGEWHHSYGVTPSMPMYKAAESIFDHVRTIAKEVFGR